MSDSRSALKILAVVALVVAVGVGIGLWGSKSPTLEGPAGQSAPFVPPPSIPDANPAPVARGPEPTAPSPRDAGPDTTSPAPTPMTAAPAPSGVITNWEDRVDEILGDEEASESVKAKRLLEMFPRLPEDAQVEVAQHLSNLTTDEEYGPLSAYLVNPGLAEPVLDVLISDVLNRPNATKLPLLLEVARTDQHPKAGEALDLLQLFLEEDYGKDWPKWQERMQQWLQENPD